MGGNGSKATVLENVVKNVRKGFDRDYGTKMMPSWLRTLCKVEWPTVGVGWPPKGTMDFNTVSLCHSYRKIWTPRSVPIYRLLSRDSSGTPQMGLILYPKWGGENINGSKSNQR